MAKRMHDTHSIIPENEKMNYYCRLCDSFVLGNEAISERHYSNLPGKNMATYYDVISCPDCGEELIEYADECICGELKLESEHLCRNCRKIAKEAWEDSVDAIYRRINTFRSDAEAILLEYVDKEVAYE